MVSTALAVTWHAFVCTQVIRWVCLSDGHAYSGRSSERLVANVIPVGRVMFLGVCCSGSGRALLDVGWFWTYDVSGP